MADEGFKRKLTAILSADVIEYSRLMRDDEEATVRDLAAHRVLITEIIQQHNGRVVDSPGDNILAEFASVVDAVNGAIKIQDEIRKSNTGIPQDRRMEFRIGINLGDVIEEEERIYGDGLNIAARVEGLAAGGGVAISGTVYEHIKDKLSLGYHYLGEQDMKNIPEPVRVYRLLTEPEDAGKMIEAEKPKVSKWRYAAFGTLALIILVAGVLVIWNYYFRLQIEPASLGKMAFPLPEKPSIAVLPFDNMSRDPDQEYIADGFTENIITTLSKIPEIFVISRNSTFTYKGKPVKIRQVSEELGVRYVLEGSVQKAEDRLRITAQLIDAVKGHHLWAERYDREFKDLFALQDEITMKILTALEVKLTRGEMAREYETENIEAWGDLVRTYSLFERATKEDNAKARELVEQALKLDPDYASALVMLGRTHSMEARMGWSESPAESVKQALELAQKVVALRETEGSGHKLLAMVYYHQRQYDMAIAEGERAIALGPNDGEAHAFLAYTQLFAGRFEEAIVHIEKAMRLHPHYPAWYLMVLADCYFMAGRHDESIAVNKHLLERARRGEFRIYIGHLGLAANYMLLGREEEARFHAAEVRRTNPSYSLEDLTHRNPYKDPEQLERWLNPLRKAGIPEHPPLKLPDKPSIAVLPFINLSGDPEQDYFSDGFTINLIFQLYKIPGIFVIARGSAFKYKGKAVDVRQVGRELGVRYVLEGSVQRAKNQIRVTTQLVEAATGSQKWAERYDRELKDIFAVQDEITRKVVNELAVKIAWGESWRLESSGTDNYEAFDYYMQADKSYMRIEKEGNIRARELLFKALELDPKYARAIAMVGYTHLLDAMFRWVENSAQSLKQAEEWAHRALAIDDNVAHAHTILGRVYILTRQFEKGISAAKRAVECEPTNGMVKGSLAYSLNLAGKPEEALVQAKEAIRLSPCGPYTFSFHATAGFANYFTRQYEAAITECKKCLGLQQHGVRARDVWHCLIASYMELGQGEEARAEAKKLLEKHPDFSIKAVVNRINKSYKDLSFLDRHVELLRKVGLPE